MDNSNKPSSKNNQSRIPLGMNTFGPTEREEFGQSVRIAMACIEAAPEPIKGCALPQDESAIRHRLKALSQEITSNHADLLELLVRFDNVQGWKSSGASHCAAWMNLEIGISNQLSWEYLRVGRKLQTLPTVQALFRVGKLSWSKVRLITRVATIENEKILCHAALDASVSDVKRICEGYKWNEDENNEGENARAIQQWTSRALTWNEASNGCTRIQLVLPPETAQAFLNSVEQSLSQLGTVGGAAVGSGAVGGAAVGSGAVGGGAVGGAAVGSAAVGGGGGGAVGVDSTADNTMSQSRADAAVLMAETSLQNAGREIASADRYQVMVSIDASELATDEAITTTDESIDMSIDMQTDTATDIPPAVPTKLPTKRATLLGVGSIATETARRIACDCSLSINIMNKSEPIDIGRKSRIWPAAMARAIKEPDQHCVWPGCTHSRHLHIHHIEHWANGGGTSPHNGACLCAFHHMLVHEGGYTIEHVKADSPQHHEQFIRQQHNDDVSQFDFEKSLRTDQESFDTVRKLSPTRFRYEIRDSRGQIISGHSSNDAMCAEQPERYVVPVNNVCAKLPEPTHLVQTHNTRVEQIDNSRAAQSNNVRVEKTNNSRAALADKTLINYNPALHADANGHTHVYSNNRCSEAIPNTYYGKKKQSHFQGYIPAVHRSKVHTQAFTYETPYTLRPT